MSEPKSPEQIEKQLDSAKTVHTTKLDELENSFLKEMAFKTLEKNNLILNNNRDLNSNNNEPNSNAGIFLALSGAILASLAMGLTFGSWFMEISVKTQVDVEIRKTTSKFENKIVKLEENVTSLENELIVLKKRIANLK